MIQVWTLDQTNKGKAEVQFAMPVCKQHLDLGGKMISRSISKIS